MPQEQRGLGKREGKCKRLGVAECRRETSAGWVGKAHGIEILRGSGALRMTVYLPWRGRNKAPRVKGSPIEELTGCRGPASNGA